ncbi:MAG: alpha/beta hydrolase [Kastovskya adunca ATA6-11-RM4]|nr:alpha/beta hydrolase [Kastovskya adunca ATA6-11-RM4]
MHPETVNRLLVGVRWFVVAAVLIYSFFGIFAYFFADNLIFQPQPASYKDTDKLIKLTTADGVEISALHLPNPEATYTILYSHGNAEDLGDIQPVLTRLQEAGFAVFAYDYRGYGTSQGTPSEENVYQDITAAYDYLTQRLNVPPQQIISHGRSVGTGVAVDLATRQPLGGLIMESGFTSAFRVLLPVDIFPFDRFGNLKKIKKVQISVLFIHGKADGQIPLRHSQQLFEAANEPKRAWWVEQAGHNNLVWVAGDRYSETLQAFAQLIRKSE